MGTLLANRSQFNFQRFKGFGHAYRAVFDYEAKDLFSGDDGDTLRVLELVRNVLIHRGGVADRAFFAKFQRLAPTSAAWFPRPELDKRIALNGEHVQRFAISTSAIGIRLLEFVRKWMEANPEKPHGV